MKFNIAYLGPENLFNLRRDFILILQYSLQDLGHDVVLSGATLDRSRFNLLIGAYFLKVEHLAEIAASGIHYAHINTEVISNDLLNHNPLKVDFLGAYLPSLKRGQFVWDVIMDNMSEYERYGANAYFLRWGSHAKMRDIQHKSEKDLDFYFFGMLSERRKLLLNSLLSAGFTGMADHSCPYFVRNDRIARSRIQLNLIQDDKYTHVNSFRICYLAENACCIVSEKEADPAGYLTYAEVVGSKGLVEMVATLLRDNQWRTRGEYSQARFGEHDMKVIMEKLLEESFVDKSLIPNGA